MCVSVGVCVCVGVWVGKVCCWPQRKPSWVIISGRAHSFASSHLPLRSHDSRLDSAVWLQHMAGHLNRKVAALPDDFHLQNWQRQRQRQLAKSIWAIISVDMLAVIIDRNDKTKNQKPESRCWTP